MDLQQIGLQHPAVKAVQHIQNNTAPNRHKLFVAEGLWAHNMLLETGAPIDTFLWCPEAIYADEAHVRAREVASRASRAFRISPRTLEKISERDKPDARRWKDIWSAGHSVSGVADVPSVAELVKRTAAEYLAARAVSGPLARKRADR